MIYLVNYTSEKFEYTYGGLSKTILPGETKKVLEPEGNHALNALGARGLSKKEFDDDGKIINEEKNKSDAVERNIDFKKRQIYTYNFRNETRKASGQPYDVPTPTVKRYSAELGINLLQPYTMAEGEKAEIAKLNKESEAKDKAISDLTQMIAEQNKVIEEIRKQMVVKPTMPNDMVVCTVCGEEVMAKTLKSHMNFKHKEK
jgi:hypothetical protein